MRSEDATPGTLLAIRHGATPGRLTLVVRSEEGSRAYPVAERFYLALGSPAVGYLLTEEETEALLAHVAERRALASALGSLARGDESRRNLYCKLRRKGPSDTAARAALDEVENFGYLREADNAERLAARCAGKGWSRRKTHAYLVSRGYPGATVTRAIDAAIDSGDADFVENKRRFREKQEALGRSPEEVRRALWRAGF